MTRRRLLALDMDGTLFRSDGTIAPRDREAIARARERGVTVSLVTGRLASGAVPTALELQLDAPVVCADGGLTLHAHTGEWLEHSTLRIDVAETCARTLVGHRLAPFLMMHDAIHADATSAAHCAWVSIWTRNVRVHGSLADAHDWRHENRVALAVGVGPREQVMAAADAVDRAHPDCLELVTFAVRGHGEVRPQGGHWAVLLRPRGISKGAALARLAGRLGVAREDVAAVGDWHNDVSMLSWAGASYAMGQAPESVKKCAKHTLQATSETGGGVAEAISRWLDEAP